MAICPKPAIAIKAVCTLPAAATRIVLASRRTVTSSVARFGTCLRKLRTRSSPSLLELALVQVGAVADEGERRRVDRLLHLGAGRDGTAVIDGAAGEAHDGQDRKPEEDGGPPPRILGESPKTLHRRLDRPHRSRGAWSEGRASRFCAGTTRFARKRKGRSRKA